MKKQLITIIILLFVLMFAITSCTVNKPETANDDGIMDDMTTGEPVAPIPAQEGDDGIMDDMTTQEPVGAMPHDNLPTETTDGATAMANLPKNQDVPITPTATPNFFSQDMQNLYNSAYQMYFHFTVIAGFGESSNTTITINDDMTMYLDNGYDTYDDFITALESMFTSEFIQSELLASNQYLKGDDGKLYTTAGARGSNIMYESSEFILKSASDSEIVIELVATYNENAMQDELEPVYYTETYSIVLQNTENGWRFSDFDIAI